MDYIDFSVSKVIALKDKYGFRIKLLFHDGKEIVHQMGGFANRREANRHRDRILADLYCGAYVIDESYTVKSFLDMWLKEVMLPNIKASTYATYFYTLKNHIVVIGFNHQSSICCNMGSLLDSKNAIMTSKEGVIYGKENSTEFQAVYEAFPRRGSLQKLSVSGKMA